MGKPFQVPSPEKPHFEKEPLKAEGFFQVVLEIIQFEGSNQFSIQLIERPLRGRREKEDGGPVCLVSCPEKGLQINT